jgi:hypothetical protein
MSLLPLLCGDGGEAAAELPYLKGFDLTATNDNDEYQFDQRKRARVIQKRPIK